MPKETFFNLDFVKQERIAEAAIQEFAEKGYQRGSIQNIADRAGVAKGSMYQYFESKKELFFHIMDIAVQKKIELLAEYVEQIPRMTFFELLEVMIIQGLRFAVQQPELYRIYEDIQSRAPDEIRDQFNQETQTLGHRYYGSMIKMAVEKGELRKDVNEEMAAFVVYSLLKEFSAFLMSKAELTDEKAHRKYVRQLMEVLKSGIQV